MAATERRSSWQVASGRRVSGGETAGLTIFAATAHEAVRSALQMWGTRTMMPMTTGGVHILQHLSGIILAAARKDRHAERPLLGNHVVRFRCNAIRAHLRAGHYATRNMDQAVALEGAALANMHIVQHLAFGNAQRARVPVCEDALRVLGKEVRKRRLANVRVARIAAQQMEPAVRDFPVPDISAPQRSADRLEAGADLCLREVVLQSLGTP